MKLFDNKLFRGSLLSLVYALGVFFIVASGGSGSSSGDDDSCRLVVSAIAPVAGSDDIWVGVLSELPGGDFNSVSRLRRNGSEALPPIPLDRGSDNVIRTIAVDAISNDVYVGGDFSEGIFRLNEDGSLDNSFDVGSGFNGPVSTIVAVADGSGDIYVGGFFSEYDRAPLPVGGLVRLNADGSLDANYTTSAIQAVARAGSTYPGSVYSGGYVFPRLARWTSTASRDSDFTPSGGIGPVFSIALVAGGAGAVYVGGDFSPGIYRIDNAGRTDIAFAVGSGFNDSVRKIVHTADFSGDIYAIGAFTTYQDEDANGLVRLNPEGSPEANFFPGTGFGNSDRTVPFGEFASSALAADASGDLYVGGDFTDYDGTTLDGLVRLNNDGTIDPVFDARISSEGGTCTDGSFDKDD